MSLKAYALTTVDRLKAYLGITSSLTSAQNTVMEVMINSATEYIEKYIGFRVKKTTYTQEEYDSDGDGVILLKRHPLTATAITVQRRLSDLNEDSWETIDSQYYHIDRAAGIIKGAGGYKFPKTTNGIRVTYEAGYDFDNSSTYLSDTEGGDLELACWILAGSLYKKKGAPGDIKSESIGDYSVEYGKTVFENPELREILDLYAGPSVGGVQTPYVY